MLYSMGKTALFIVVFLAVCGSGPACAADVWQDMTGFFDRGTETAASVLEEGQRISENIMEEGGKAIDAVGEVADKIAEIGRGQPQTGSDASADVLSFGSGPGYSRLMVHNQCYRDIWAEIEGFENTLFYQPRYIGARDRVYFELWRGSEVISRTYVMTRDGAPALHKTLEEMVAGSEKSTSSLRSIDFQEYIYTFCNDEPDLETPNAEFAYAAKSGEQIDVFEIFLTQVPGSTAKEFVYDNYPVIWMLNGYPLLHTNTDDDGYVRISFPQGTQGLLSIDGMAFSNFEGLVLYKEWAPIHSFTAKGGETVYRIPPHRNTTGW